MLIYILLNRPLINSDYAMPQPAVFKFTVAVKPADGGQAQFQNLADLYRF